MVWSCINESKKMNKKKKKAIYNCDKKKLFVIDKRPNLSYLRCLRSDTKNTEYRKTKQKSFCNKTTSLVKPIKRQMPMKCSNQRKKRRINNLDSNSTESNANCSEKRTNLDGKNNKTNSTSKLREIVVDGCNVAMAYDIIFFLIVINFHKIKN